MLGGLFKKFGKKQGRKDLGSDLLENELTENQDIDTIPEDQASIKKLADEKNALLGKVSEIDNEIIAIQRSTRTNIRFLLPAHNSLRMRYKWYYKWHLCKFASLIHYIILAIYILLVSATFFFASTSGWNLAKLFRPDKTSLAATSWVVSGAGDTSYNGTYIETGTQNGDPYYVYNSNRYLFRATNPLGAEFWRLNSSLQADSTPPVSAWYYGSSGAALPANTWTKGTPGTAPAPSLAQAVNTIDISGTCKQYDKTTNCADEEVIKIAVNGTLQAGTGTTATGVWSITGVTAAADDILTVFVDNVADANEANAVVKVAATPANITGVTLFERHVTIGASSNLTLTNANLALYDNSVSTDEDIFFEVDASNNLLIPATSTQTTTDQQLYILASNTYAPDATGGKTVTVPNLNLPASATLTAGANTYNITASGTPFARAGTFTAAGSTVKYTGAGATTLTAADYNNLEAVPASMPSSGWLIGETLSDPSYTGTYAASGTMNGYTKYTNGSKWLYYNFAAMDSSYQWVLASSASDCGDLYYCAAYYQYPGASVPNSGTWYTGMDYTGTPTFTVTSSSYVYTFASGTFNVSGNYTNGTASVTVETNATTNDPIINIDGNFSNLAGSTFIASDSAAFSVASNFTNVATGKFTDSAGTLAFDGQGLQTITAGGTDADHDFKNLTVTNASTSGVSFADSATVIGTFADTTAGSKLTFHAGSTYAFANISIAGASGNRVTMKSSTDTQHWHFNVTQEAPSVSYVSARDSDASGGNGISAVIGSSDGTGNTNWTFSGTTITVSGTVYAAENKTSNIGADKTVRIVVNGDAGSSTTVSTTEGGAFSFGGIVLSTNNPVLVYLSGEAEKASLITQAATATNDITGLELYTNHVVLTHESAGPLTNAVIGTAIAATDTDNLMTIDGSSNVTFSVLDNIETWIQGGKTYTPGAEAYFGSLDILSTATFNPENNLIAMNDSGTPFAINGTFNVAGSTVLYQGLNATNVTATTYNNLKVSHTGTTFTAAGNITVSGVFTIEAGAFDASNKTITLSGAGTPFVNTGTLTASTSTFKYTGAEATTITAADYYNLETVPASAPAGGGGWIVASAEDSSYNGTYTASGTMNGYTKYTNGSRWLYYNLHDMPEPGYEWALYSSASNCFDPYSCTAYYQYPGATAPNFGTWYATPGFTGTPAFTEAASSYVYTFSSGTFNISGNYTNGTASVTVETNATTNDPIINIDGNFANLAGSTFIASNSAAFSVASNFTNSATGKFTDSGGTLTLDGQGLQTITAGGTTANFDFTNLTITNADSTNGVSFADSVTVTGTFTDVTASSKVTFLSGGTYAFNAMNINGQATGTRITLTSSSSGTAWNLNITAASPTASNISVKDSNANKDIDATTGGYDNTGNTHWVFPVSVYVSGTVYTTENKGSNIGANKTVALSINGGTKITDETDSSGIFRFDDVNIGANNPITLFLEDEAEKASLVTIAADGTSAIGSLEMYTNRAVLTHASAGPMSNTVLATADNACTSDCLFSVDGSSVATFTSAYEVFIPTTKTYTPGAAIVTDDIEIDGTLTLAGNAATVHGSWDSADGFFSSSGTVIFDAASGTEALNTGGVGGDGGWAVTNDPGDSSYDGAYTPSGTFNGQPTYTNGSRWLYYNYDEMGMSYYWVMYTSVTNLMDGGSSAGYYADATISGTWYENYMIGNGPAPAIESVAAKGGSFTNVVKSGGGTLQLASNAIDIDGTLSISASNTFDINGQNITLATLSNDGTFKLQGAETAPITTFDSNSGTVEYSGTSTYSSLLLGDTYAGLKINGTGGAWTLDADLTVSGVLDINAGTLSASSRTITLSGSGTPFIVTGTFSEGTSTVIYTGSSATNVAGSTYKNLKLNHAGTTFTAAGDTLVKSVFTIEAGTFDASNRTITLSGSGTPFVKTGTFVASTSTIAYTSPYDTNITTADYYHLDLVDPPEWLTGWNKRVKVEVLDTNIDSDLTNFPLMLKLGASVGTGSDDTTAVFDEVGSNSKKIAVTATDGTTEIYVEIEKWDNVGEEAILWVSKSDLVFSGSATTDLYLYYDNNHADNTTYVGATGSRPEVWDSNYTAVYHSNQATDAQMLDSTGDHNATPGKTSGSNPVSTTSGKIGSAFTYDSSDQRKFTTDITSGKTLTWEAWANASAYTGYHSMLSVSTDYLLFDQAGNGLAMFSTDGMGGNNGGVSGLSTNTFYRMAFVRVADNTTDGYKFYKDGVATGTTYNTGSWSASSQVTIGNRDSSLDQGFEGVLDEVRVSSSVRSAAWLKADYYSQTDGLVNWGTEEGAPGSAVYTMGSGTFNIDGDLTIGNSIDEMSVNADTNDPIINVNGSMEITANSTFVASGSAAFSVASHFSNSGIFTDSAGTLTLDGQGLQTITAGGTDGNHDFHNLATTNASAAGVSFADSATVAGTFTDVTPSSKATFLSGGTYAFNAININGQATGTRVSLTSSSSGTAWNLNITAASPTASNVSVKDSNANKDIDATTGGEDLTGNTHWLFPTAGATISGTIYSAEDKSTNIGADKNVALSVNGAAAATATTASGGVFSFSDITVAPNDTVALFVNDETEKGSFITQASGSGSITGIEMYTSHIILSHDTAGPMTNTLLDTADNVADTDLLASVASSNATFTTGNELWVVTGKTYTPGGGVTADDINIAGTLSMGANTLTASGSLSNSGTISTTGSTTFNATATGKNITSGGSNLGSVTFNGLGGEWTLQDNLTASSITMTNGRLYDNAKTVTVNGSIMLADVANLLTSTGNWIVAGSGSVNNFVTDPNYISNIFKNLTIKTGTTVDIDDYLNVRKLTIENSVTLTGNYLHFYPEANNYFIQGESDSINLLNVKIHKHLGDQGVTLEQGKINMPNTSLTLAYGTGVIHKMTASWAVGSFRIEGGGPDDTEAEATTLDTNGYNLAVNGNLTYGETRVGIANGFHAKILFGTGTHTIAGDLKANITGATDTHGYLYLGSSNISVGGGINFSKTTVDAGTGTVHLNGSAAQTITSNSNSFCNLSVTNASTAGVVFADSATLTGTLTDTTASSKITFNSGSTYAFNAININGQAINTRVTLTSSSAGSAWNLNITAASPTALYVSVKDSNANKDVDATTGGEDLTGNTHWLFPPTGITISGTIYSAEDKSTNIGADKTVALSVNGAAATTVKTTTGGVFSFIKEVSANNTVTIFITGEAEKGSLITQALNDSADITGLELYTSHIVLTHDTAGPMTNTLLAVADNIADTDLLVSVSGSDATFATGNKVWILGGKTFTPGGNVSCGSLEILTTGTFTPEANTVTVNDSGTPYIVTGTFNEGTSTVIYTGSSATSVTGTTYNNLRVNQTGTTFTAAGDITVKAAWTIQAGTFDGSSRTITLTGVGTPFVNSGTFTASSSTIKYTGAGDTTISAATYYNLETSPSATPPTGWAAQNAGDSTYNENYAENGTNDGYPSFQSQPSGRWIYYKAMWGGYLMGTVNGQNSVAAAYSGPMSTTMSGGQWSVLNGTSPAPYLSQTGPYTYTFAAGTTNIAGNYVNGDGTHAVITTADANDPTLNIDGNYSNSTSATFIASNSATFSIASNYTNSGIFSDSTGTLTLDGQGLQTITAGGTTTNFDFFNLTITNSSVAGVSFADSATVSGTFTDVTAGSKLTFHALSTYTFAAININGQATETKITMVSSDPANGTVANRQWYLNVSSTSPQATFVNVTDSDASGGNAITPVTSTNGGNNENWLFGITISGAIYSTEDKSANISANKTVAISVNGAAATAVKTTTGGAFSFVKEVSVNNTVAIYLSGETEKASYITQVVDDTTNLTGLELYTSHIVLTHHTSGPVTNTLLATADNVSDADLLVSVSGSDATFTTGNEVWILGNKTYTPGGNVTCGSIDILSTAAFAPEANTATLTDSSTPFAINGTFNEGTSTIIYTGSSNTNVAGTTYNNLTVSQAGATFTAAGDITVKSVWTIQAGTFDGSSRTITLNGSSTPFVNNGTFTASSSTVKYEVSSSTNITAADYNNLELIDPPKVDDQETSTELSLADAPLSHALNRMIGIEQTIGKKSDNITLAMKDTSTSLQVGSKETEVVAKRTRNFKTFDLGGDKFRIGGSVGPIHYKVNPYDRGEDFKEIDLSISKTPFAEYDYAMEQNGYQAYFWNNKLTGRELTEESVSYAARFQRAGHYLEMAPVGLEWQNNKGETEVIRTVQSTSSEPSIDNAKNNITWRDAFGPNIDFSYNISPDKFFKTVIVRDKNALPDAHISKEGLKLNVLMSFAWDQQVRLADQFANDAQTVLTNQNIDEAQTILDHPEKYISTDELQRNLWSMQTPQAWDSQRDTKLINMDWKLVQSGSSVIASISAPADFITSTDTVYPIYIDAAIDEEQVGASGDDVKHSIDVEHANYHDLNTNSAWLGTGNPAGPGINYIWDTGIRFSSIPIPSGSTISNAAMSFKAYSSGSGNTVNSRIYAVDEDSSAAITSDSDWHSRNLTTNYATWNGIEAWTADTWYDSPSFASVTSEVVERAGWAENNNIQFIWADNGSNGGAFRQPYSYDSSSANAPKLNITYTAPKVLTLSSGTFNIAGNLTIGDGTNNSKINADTNDPVINVDGNMSILANGTFVASASASFSVASDYSNAGIFTDSAGTLTLDGQGSQTITAGGTDTDHDFNNLTITNASTTGVTFADSATVAGTFTDVTPSSKATFHSGSTYAFNAININGQAEGTKITLTSSSSGSAWNLNITAASPTASNVSVKDSNANKDIDATTGGEDLTGNTHWLFPILNTAPVNNSLTFTNPYSSNIAIADNTTEWSFQAVVTDADGVGNLNYVELHLANSSDASQPYDSLKVRWTEGSGAFSEIADSQNAIVDIASSTSSVSGAGTEKTINFKLKFNANFLTEDTNYAAELLTVDDAAASDTDNFSNIYQIDLLSLNLAVDSATFDFGSLLPGSVITGSTITTVTTNYPNGYSLSAHDLASGSNSALLHSDNTTRIADYSGSVGLPTLWSGNGLGICVFAATGKDATKWGAGTTAGDSSNKYAGVPENATIVHSKTSSPTISDQTSIGYKLVVSNDQKTGAYSGIITYTGTGVLN